MSLFRSFCLPLVLAAALTSSAYAQVRVSSPIFTEAETAAHERLEKALAKTVSYEFKGTPLKEVIAKLADDSDLTFVITKKIEDAGVAADQPIHRKLSKVTLRAFLKLLLGDLNLTWMWKDEAIRITTIEDACAPENLEIRLYPVLDLVEPSQPTKDGKANDYLNPLCKLILTTIEPDSWQDVGGPGSVEHFENAGCLVISQRDDVHERIERLIITLRRVKEAQGLPKPAATAPLNRYLQPPVNPRAAAK